MNYLTIIKLAVGALLIVLLVRQTEDIGEVASLIAAVRPGDLAAAILTFAVAVALNALRWRYVLVRMGATISHPVALVGTFEGMFFNLFLPTGVGGDAARAYRAYATGLTAADVIHSTLIDRAIGLWGLSLFLLVAMPLSTLASLDLVGWTLIVLAAVIVAGGLIAAIAGRAISGRSLPMWVSHLRDLVRRYGDVVLSRVFWLRIVPLLTASNVAICLSGWFAFRATGIAVPPADAAAIVETASLSALLPVTIGGWGLREGVVVFLLQGLGYANASATAASAVFGLTVLAMGPAGLAVWYLYPHRGLLGAHGARPAENTEPADAGQDH